ncbi:hypothetical protein Ancab_038840 [Ancistrocladus abbreviatus]
MQSYLIYIGCTVDGSNFAVSRISVCGAEINEAIQVEMGDEPFDMKTIVHVYRTTEHDTYMCYQVRPLELQALLDQKAASLLRKFSTAAIYRLL